MRRLMVFGILTLSLMGSALAQPPDGPPPGQNQRTLDPEVQKKFEAYRVVFDLLGSVGLMDELDKQKDLSFSKPQAQKLLPILKNLQTRPDLKPADAEKILSTIENNILTPAQLKWMDQTLLKRQEEARKRREQGQQGQNGQNQFPGQQGTRPGGSGGRGGFFQAIAQGKPYNPFKEQPRSADNLKALIATLSKK